jgi:hypothetical protein
MAMKHGRDHGSYRGRMHGDISESAALPTSRYGNNRESQAPRKPLNQVILISSNFYGRLV